MKKRVCKEKICATCGEPFLPKASPQVYCDDCTPGKYCFKFDENCREDNRKKYNRECFFCGLPEEENGRRLAVHHADYNKNQGCGETPDWKLVPLCDICHGITGGGIENRKLWEARILFLHKEYWLYYE